MKTVATCGASFSCFSPQSASIRSVTARLPSRVCSKRLLSNALIQRRHAIAPVKLGNIKADLLSRKRTATRACMRPSDSENSAAPIAPLQLESPVGQFLSEILVSQPHLIPAAVEQQLEQLQTARDAEKEKQEPSASSTDLVLYRRIAEVKANERKKALEEILYALVVQRFMDAKVPLVPAIAHSSPNNSGRVDMWPPPEDQKLEQLYSPEAYELIENHLTLILGNRLTESTSVAQISKLRVGQVYAASIHDGYFLKRIDQRFQLEKTMKTLPQGTEILAKEVMADEGRRFDSPDESSQKHPEVSSGSSGTGFFGLKPCRLRAYVMSLDGETLQRYATIRSKESVIIVEKHTQALFGRPEMIFTPDGNIDPSKDQNIRISFGGFRRLVLEAVTFGSFLWDVESYVDSRYHFVTN